MSQDPTLDLHDTPRPHDLPTPPSEDLTTPPDSDTQMAEHNSAVSAALPEATPSNASSSSNVLTPKDKYDKIVALAKREMVAGETWYVVSHRWYRRWEKACTGVIDKEGPIEEKDIGPVDNGHLADINGNLTDASVAEGVDVDFVPEEAWELLVEWYVCSGTGASLASCLLLCSSLLI